MNESIPTQFLSTLYAAQTGDRKSLDQLLRPRLERLHGLASRKLGTDLNRELDASDLVQDVMVAATQGLGRFRGENEAALDAWLRAIFDNQLRRFLRDRAPKIRNRRSLELFDGSRYYVDVEALQTSVFGRVERRQKLSILERTLDWLPDADRWLLERKHLSGVDASWDTIAAELKVTSIALRKRASRLYDAIKHGMRLIERIDKRQLPEPLARVICLKYLRRLNVDAIAQELGQSRKQVMESIKEAEAMLR